VYVIIAVVIFFPQLFLVQYSNALGRYTRDKNPADLENALKKQNAFWMYMGILMIIYLAFFVIALLAGGLTAFSRY